MQFFQSGRARLLSGMLAIALAVTPVMAGATYTVKSGDTLEKIAHHLAIPQAELVRLNHIEDSDSLALGQELKLPAPATSRKHAKQDDTSSAPSKQGKHPASTSRALSVRELARQRKALLAKGNRVVSSAKTMIGTPYVWGGDGTSRGIDCSGLVLKSMREALGVHVPHHAAELYRMGTPVTLAQLQPGDLIFFNTSGNGVSHVGIWVGNNTFIHASCRHGVEQQKLAGYYAKRLVGARRLN